MIRSAGRHWQLPSAAVRRRPLAAPSRMRGENEKRKRGFQRRLPQLLNVVSDRDAFAVHRWQGRTWIMLATVELAKPKYSGPDTCERCLPVGGGGATDPSALLFVNATRCSTCAQTPLDEGPVHAGAHHIGICDIGSNVVKHRAALPAMGLLGSSSAVTRNCGALPPSRISDV